MKDMKRKHTVKRHLAVLMAAILLATSLPVSALAAVNLGGGENDDWKIKGITMEPDQKRAYVGNQVRVYITGVAQTKSDIDGEWTDAIECATASDAMKEIDRQDIKVSVEGDSIQKTDVTVSEITWNGMEGTFSVRSSAAGTVKLALGDGNSAPVCSITYEEKTYSLSDITDLGEELDTKVINVPINMDEYIYIIPGIGKKISGKDYEQVLLLCKDALKLEIGDSSIATAKVVGIEEIKGLSANAVKIKVTGKSKGKTNLTVICEANVEDPSMNPKSSYDIVVGGGVYGDIHGGPATVLSDESKRTKLKNKLIENLELGAEEKKAVFEYADDILDYQLSYWVGMSGILNNEEIMELIHNKYKKEIDNGNNIWIRQEINVTDIDWKLNEALGIDVNRMDVDWDIKLYINDKFSATLDQVLSEAGMKDKYIPIHVSVYATFGRGQVAKWTHYVNEKREREDNSVFLGGNRWADVMAEERMYGNDWFDDRYTGVYVSALVNSFGSFSLDFNESPDDELLGYHQNQVVDLKRYPESGDKISVDVDSETYLYFEPIYDE